MKEVEIVKEVDLEIVSVEKEVVALLGKGHFRLKSFKS